MSTDAPAGYRRVVSPGGIPVLVLADAAPAGDCPTCGAERLCDGSGTLHGPGGWSQCPYRAIHELRHPRRWSVERQDWEDAPGRRPLPGEGSPKGGGG